MNRKHVVLYRAMDLASGGFVPGTPAERIALVWPLTREVISLSKKYNAKQRLQRHVTRLIRREG